LQPLAKATALTADVRNSRGSRAWNSPTRAYRTATDIPRGATISRRVVLNNWDRKTINLPFGRFAVVVEQPVRIEPAADDAGSERARLAVETGLNAATKQAYAVVDKGLDPGAPT